MRICWATLEGMAYNKATGKFRKKGITYKYREACRHCGDPFLSESDSIGEYCSNSCRLSARLGRRGRVHQKEARTIQPALHA